MIINKKIVLVLISVFTLVSCNKDIIGSSSKISSSLNESSQTLSSSQSEDNVSSTSYKGRDSSLNSSTSSNVVSSSSSINSNTSSQSTTSLISYYSNVNLNLTGAELKTELFNKISNHKSLGYSGVTGTGVYAKTDVKEDGTIWDIYSNTTSYKPSDLAGNYKKEGDCYNREHTIPQSVFSKKEPMRSDVHHLFPTDGYVNNRRGNYPHAEVGSVSYSSNNNFTIVGESSTSGVTGTVCEPNDLYKGDIARTYFYFVTCYQDKLSSFGSFAAFSNNTYPSLSNWAIKLYLKWAKEDPVSEKEIKRNEAIYQIQGNRNPFIDYPELAEKVWNS